MRDEGCVVLSHPSSLIPHPSSLIPCLMRITFLGTGTSVGVPMVGCECTTCTSDDPRDQRSPTATPSTSLDLLIIDALRYKPHPTHLQLDQTLAYIAELKPQHVLLTHISHDIAHADASRRLLDGVEFAYHGLKLEM